MDKQRTKRARDAELMGENIIGIFLSREPLCESNHMTEDYEPKLRRFVNDQESIQQPRLIDSGKHGVVVLAVMNGIEYALKVVSTIALITALI